MTTTPEGKFQAQLIKYLRSKGAFVLKYQQNATTIQGVADVFFCKEGFYGWLECKRSKNAPLRPGQKEFIAKMDEWSWARICYPENWPQIQQELEEVLL